MQCCACFSAAHHENGTVVRNSVLLGIIEYHVLIFPLNGCSESVPIVQRGKYSASILQKTEAKIILAQVNELIAVSEEYRM